MTEVTKDLHGKACAALKNAHAPYSKCLIGAALILNNGKIYSGCNIENASYGGTVCAERVAIWKALSENPGAKIKEICVVSDQPEAWPPCGFCRQVMAEFATADTVVDVGNLLGLQKTFKLNDLFPEAFSKSHLLG